MIICQRNNYLVARSVRWNRALEANYDRAEPIFREVNDAAYSESRNRFTNVTFLVNALSVLVGTAGFERDGCSADTAEYVSLRRGSDGACHAWSSLRTTESTGKTRT